MVALVSESVVLIVPSLKGIFITWMYYSRAESNVFAICHSFTAIAEKRTFPHISLMVRLCFVKQKTPGFLCGAMVNVRRYIKRYEYL